MTSSRSPARAGSRTQTRRKSSPEPGRTPVELFGEYLGSRGVADQRVAELFRTLHERITG